MGRSTASCFKIMACGGDSAADNDDSEAPEIKGDKKGWSFRKRSARHRVLSNTVISETAPPPPPPVKKDAPESAAYVNFEAPADAEVPEKAHLVQFVDEKPQLPASVDSKLPDAEPVVDSKTEGHVDFKMEESAATSIQSAVRRFLAQKELLKLKNVIALQAAVRGHLVRMHAVGTLRCVQAIVKMQSLVRARRSRALVGGHLENNVVDGKPSEDYSVLQTSEKAIAKKKPPVAYVSIEQLLSNRFARQLLESSPRGKPINIKCDVSKSDSAWQWLARWSAASSPEPSPNVIVTFLPSGTEDSLISKPDAENSSGVYSNPRDSVSSKTEAAETLESDYNPVTYEEDKTKFEELEPAPQVVPEASDPPAVEEATERDHPRLEEIGASTEKDTPSIESSAAGNITLPLKPDVEIEQPKRSMKRSATDELEMEAKKSVFGSKKATNPSFIAAQSKFKELSSTANSGGLTNVSAESKVENSLEDSVNETKEPSSAEVTANQMRTQAGGSECGTELSISSTLDSPDRYDAGATESANNEKVPEEESCTSNGFIDQKVIPGSTAFPDLNLSNSGADHPEKSTDGVTAELADPGFALEVAQAQHEIVSSPDQQREAYTESAQQTHNRSPEASPRSHMTVPEPQGTPASQASVNTKGSKVEKTGSNSIHKRKSLSKRLQSSPLNDSGASSTNKLSDKDQKSSKRRTSFGSSKTENADQEPRDSSSSSSLPHFMQATESAKAKVNANNSPRSSPDVSDREVVIKKRHSLPGSNGRQGSPRIQRATSQTQQGGKGNDAPAQERKWLR